MTNSFNALRLAQDQIADLDLQLLKRKLKATQSPCDTKAVVNGRELKAFCSNDYLGLANHPDLIQAIAEGAKIYGVGSGASHLISGHSVAHEILEAKLAAFQKQHIPDARALFFSTGYLTNLTAITAFARLAPQGYISIYSAKLNHASLIDGVRLASAQSNARVSLFDHEEVNTLSELLKADQSDLKMIVTDGVFSMDGDLAPVKKLLELAEQHDALLLVDDAHGFGVLGKQGHGILEQENICSERIVYIGTLGKAAGVSGAFVCAHKTLIEWLIQKGRPFIYSTATPPAIAHTLTKSLDIIEGDEGGNRRAQLNQLIRIWQDEMHFSQWEKVSSCTAIQPVILGSNANALLAAKLLDEAGYWIPAIRPPTVPIGSARLRITFSANHSEADLRQLITTLKTIEQAAIQKASDE
ncbi:8-amino-7-oxononanoate synthase [Polynucleobacter sp. KF022]|uniref:aminotransferase class I/II-fold pyridoxal phosphate-dependent enzyme n=1 Tax=Polynucleobacter sp. KF022 TaxID=2982615 RepID=UPI0023771FCA|nr:8-amino-7-oxononanoate synthase [Polynucleobacter sp. KF022]BDT74491.1 8-amino-7-oxononanoate synthase [Polynucleobacter sp. KF022]